MSEEGGAITQHSSLGSVRVGEAATEKHSSSPTAL